MKVRGGYWFSGASDTKYDVAVDDAAEVFFPAAGYRFYYNCTADDRGNLGNYWSSRPSDNYYYSYAYFLYLDDDEYADMSCDYRANGFSVRCVQVTD